jgi:hypothetical protein
MVTWGVLRSVARNYPARIDCRTPSSGTMAASDEARSDRGVAADGLYPIVNRRLEWRSEMESCELVVGLAMLRATAPSGQRLPRPARIEVGR